MEARATGTECNSNNNRSDSHPVGFSVGDAAADCLRRCRRATEVPVTDSVAVIVVQVAIILVVAVAAMAASEPKELFQNSGSTFGGPLFSHSLRITAENTPCLLLITPQVSADILCIVRSPHGQNPTPEADTLERSNHFTLNRRLVP